jgi:hypothetical protein
MSDETQPRKKGGAKKGKAQLHPLKMLTDEVQHLICSFIRAGAFAHVAAEAAGIPVEVFELWIEQAKKKRNARFKLFVIAVRRAQAEARIAAEIKILKDSPLDWLKSGPGRENSTRQGWTAPTKPLVQNNTQVNMLLAPELQGLFAAILQVLAPFPEARAAVAAALAQAGSEEGHKGGTRKQIAASLGQTPPGG